MVLFPQVMQPLHVFEPRYRQLTADALAGDRYIAMALLRPGWQQDYNGNPEIYPVACLGRIVADQLLPDGRYNLLLRGMSRIQIVQEIPHTKLYRKARVDLLMDSEVEKPKTARSLRRKLGALAPHCFGEQKEVLGQVRKLFRSGLPLGTLCDIFAFALSLDVEFKQELLDELDVAKRVERLLGHLANHKACGADASDERKFPPEFSEN
jgi:Lon protease-like protein